MNNQNLWQSPKIQFFAGLAMLLAFRTVPKITYTKDLVSKQEIWSLFNKKDKACLADITDKNNKHLINQVEIQPTIPHA